MKNKRGFTLAEVLVTLAVIGVVAALTIPTIIQTSQEKQAKTAVKKALSVMNQILALSIAENGISGSSVNNSMELQNLFGNYMKIMANDDTNFSFIAADGMIYSFHKENPGPPITACGTGNNPAAAECIIEIDINGQNGGSTPATIDSYTDLYYFVVQNNTVVPANADGTWNPSSIGTFRAVSGTVDDVAVDALLN